MNSEQLKRSYDLVEIFDCDSGRIYGRIWTSKFTRDTTFYWHRMPLNMMLRQVWP